MRNGIRACFSRPVAACFFRLCLIPLFLPLFSACPARETGIAVIKTNQVEFAAYAELFNNSQDCWKAAVIFCENPAEELLLSADTPDIVIGPWIKGEKTRPRLVPLTYLFNERRLDGSVFYRPLLALGNIRGTQFSLPVSFNLPAVIFSRENRQGMSGDFLLPFSEIQNLSRAFNTEEDGVYTRMAFSPGWNPEFLYTAAQMMNVNFREAEPLFSWNEKNLRDTVIFLRDWERSVNGSAQAAEDFQFKYLYIPPEQAVISGRTLFYQEYTNELFSGPADKMRHIDFRWPAHNGRIPLKDEIIYLGICRDGPNRAAAEAFVSWFFTEDTQQEILAYSVAEGLAENAFGISDGFSSLKSVNEKIFPLYYPSLLGKMPGENQMKLPMILPNTWEEVKQEIVIPFLAESVKTESPESILPLPERIRTWRQSR